MSRWGCEVDDPAMDDEPTTYVCQSCFAVIPVYQGERHHAIECPEHKDYVDLDAVPHPAETEAA